MTGLEIALLAALGILATKMTTDRTRRPASKKPAGKNRRPSFAKRASAAANGPSWQQVSDKLADRVGKRAGSLAHNVSKVSHWAGSVSRQWVGNRWQSRRDDSGTPGGVPLINRVRSKGEPREPAQGGSPSGSEPAREPVSHPVSRTSEPGEPPKAAQGLYELRRDGYRGPVDQDGNPSPEVPTNVRASDPASTKKGSSMSETVTRPRLGGHISSVPPMEAPENYTEFEATIDRLRRRITQTSQDVLEFGSIVDGQVGLDPAVIAEITRVSELLDEAANGACGIKRALQRRYSGHIQDAESGTRSVKAPRWFDAS